MRIAFVWQGVSDQNIKSHWKDGLWAAMQIVEKKHDVVYREPWDNLDGVDCVLYWEAPCTANGKNSEHYNRVRRLNIPKIMLFAGGPIRADDCDGFDLYLVESKINEDEFSAIGKPWMRAFGINTKIFKPIHTEKIYDGIHHAASASWKRQWLMAEALKEKALVIGREQPEDMHPFNESRRLGAVVMSQAEYEELPKYICSAHTLCQTSEYWGGGQRATLEAMACGIPVVVMSDSPKNREYVEESGFGIVCDPNPSQIKEAVAKLKDNPLDPSIGINYVLSKWTEKHYAEAILKAIDNVCKHETHRGGEQKAD